MLHVPPHPSPPPATPPKPDILRGWIKTTKDAIIVFEATRAGLVPRVTRRFHDLEKKSIIQSGAVLVFTEEESGIKRWTDPYLWSASRMQGNFLMYREREDEDPASEMGSPYRCSAIAPPAESSDQLLDTELEHYILGSWNKGKGLKENGLMKKTISMTIQGTTYHLISYYYPSDVRSGVLKTPTQMARFEGLEIGPAMLASLSQFRQPPSVGKPRRGRPPRSFRNMSMPVNDLPVPPTGLLDRPSGSPYPSPADFQSPQDSDPFLKPGDTPASAPWQRSSRCQPHDHMSLGNPTGQLPSGMVQPEDIAAPIPHFYRHHSAPELAHPYSHVPHPSYHKAGISASSHSLWHHTPQTFIPSSLAIAHEARVPSYELEYSESTGVVRYECELPSPPVYVNRDVRAQQALMRTWEPVIEEARHLVPSATGERTGRDSNLPPAVVHYAPSEQYYPSP